MTNWCQSLCFSKKILSQRVPKSAFSSVDSFRSASRYQEFKFADRVTDDGEVTVSGAGLSSHNIG